MPLRTISALVQRFLTLLSSAAVLGVLIGLLLWGRVYKWKVPSFAALTGAAGADEGVKVENAAGDSATEVKKISEGNPALDGEEPPLYQVGLQSTETIRKAGIRTNKVKEHDLAQYVNANGVIEYDQRRYAELSPLAAGKIWRVLKDVGQQVRKGEVLGLVAAPDVATGKARFLQWLLQVEVRAKLLKRLKSVDEGVVAVQRLKEAEASLAEAKLHLFESTQTLTNLGLPVDPERMRELSEKEQDHKERDQRLRVLGVPDSIVQETDPLRLPTNLLPLVAPFDGEIVKRDMVEGENVTSAQVQMVVADTRHMWIRLDALQEDAAELKPGQDVRFEPDNPGLAKATGRVTWIRPDTDPKTRTVHVRAEVANPKGLLRPNTFGTGYILVRPSARVVAVPSTAIQREGKTYFVFVQIGDTLFEQRRVTLGIHTREFTEARTGLRPGETVVTAGSHILKSAIVHSRLLGSDRGS